MQLVIAHKMKLQSVGVTASYMWDKAKRLRQKNGKTVKNEQ